MTGVVAADQRGQPGQRDRAAEEPMADEMQRLWTPHRMSYIKGESKPADPSAGPHCPFCHIPTLDDDEGLVVARGELVYAVLNLYPYNTGHTLICTYRHIADLTQTTTAEAAEMSLFTRRLMLAIRAAMNPQGFNIGVNQGAIAGAGISAHLHQHVVPRWGGDANFMPIVGRTKVLPQDLADSRAVIAAAWRDLDTVTPSGAEPVADTQADATPNSNLAEPS